MSNNIKWGCIQPLTGGMYIGARNAIGHDAEWIISYDGLTSVKTDKSGEISSVGNEYNLFKWFEKNDINIPYYVFNHQMFEYIDNDNVIIKPANILAENTAWSHEDMDLVVAVPVCSGLSQATIANDETKKARNCNMEFITQYTLGVIKPKVYIFENAPGLVGTKGKPVREELETLASKYEYIVAYYKTDTQYHDNCQKRPRTFVMFVKSENNNGTIPFTLQYQNNPVSIEEYFARIPSDATQQDLIVNMSPLNKALLGFFINKYGEQWRETIQTVHYFDYILKQNLTDELLAFADSLDIITDTDKEKIHHYIEHVLFKTSQGLNYYSTTIWGYTDVTPSIMFKTILSLLHHKENRLLNIRECLHLMGMPHDFELYGEINTNASKIGQNVPVKTAEWIVSEGVRIINNWNDIDRSEHEARIFDNIKHRND